MPKSLILLTFFLIFTCLSAQETAPEDASVNSQIWLDFNGKYRLNDTRSISGFAGYRSITPRIFDKFMIVPTYDIIHTKSPKFIKSEKPLISSFHLGTGLYYTNNKYEPDNFEFRLMQGLKFFLPSIEFIPLKNYIRLEERFQKTFDGSYWTSSFRFRYRISTVIEWKKHLLSFNKGMYIPLSIEFFFNLKKADRYNDVIRISPGLGYKFNDEWKAEFYVSYHHSNNTSADDKSTNDFVFRLRIYKSTLKKTRPEINTKEEDIKELIE
jgi:hypothetical protein